MDGRPDPVDVPVPAARRGLGPVRAADDGGDPPHAVPRDGEGQDAAQRPGELHARRQLHPRRSARAAPLLRRRRLQLGGHRQLGRRRQADRRVDRRRRARRATSWDVDIRRFGAATRRTARRSPSAPARRSACTTRCAGRARSSRRRGRCARSPLYDLLAAKGAVFGAKNGWERANYFRADRRAATPAYPHTLGKPALARRRGRASSARPARRSRSTTRPRSARCCCRAATRSPCCSACAPTRWTSRPAAWSTRRCSTSAAASRATSPSPGSRADRFLIVTGSAQTTRDLDWIARHIARRTKHAALVDVSAHDRGALADGAERARRCSAASARRRPSTRSAPSSCSSRRRARSTSASRASAPRA